MNKPKIRCAIYTRKSSDEGLEQEFNSLDAQYESCAAYIASQKHEGWTLVKKRYDDGGVSGGTLERAGLKNLLTDIDAGLIDMIIVYKIDRLTRSLGDFSKIVDRLDAANASFVSVTQSFNTATSMGRLTLNMLLSFAQFEREVTAERIRDKIAASKAKGLWMGGTVPLGYAPNPDKNIRGLIVNPSNAQRVKRLFALYDTLGCLSKVEKAMADGAGKPMSRGAIHQIITNPIYIGKIKHKDKIYDGQHEAIIDPVLWERVQSALQNASAKRRGVAHIASHDAPLKGKMFDETGDHLTPTHTKKSGRIIRYYISNRLIKNKDPSGWRLPAKQIEVAIANLCGECLDTLGTRASADINSVQEFDVVCAHLRIQSITQWAQIIERIDLAPAEIKVQFNRARLAKALGVNADNLDERDLALCSPLAMKRRGVEQKLIIGTRTPEPDKTLIHNLTRAHGWLNRIKAGEGIADIAKSDKISPSCIRTRLGLALLSPKIQSAIMEGQHPPDITTQKLITITLPLNWQAQESQLGF